MQIKSIITVKTLEKENFMSSIIKITAPYDSDLLNDFRVLLKKFTISLEKRIKMSNTKAEKDFFRKEKNKICVESSE